MGRHKNFVGRENLIKEFGSRYAEFIKRPEGAEKYYALAYYGIGGIGKSWLLDELKGEVEKASCGKARYVEISLKEKTDCVALIKRLAEALNKYKYKFPAFKLAYNCYIQKASNNAAKINFTKKGSKWLRFIPIVGSFFGDAGSLLGDVLVIAAEEREIFMKSNRELRKKIEAMDMDELYENLPKYFAEDMKKQLEKENGKGKAPIVVFIDIYENLVSEISPVGNPLGADKWLRGDDGILKSIPGIFWVIGGRESLKWEQYNNKWEEKLEQFKVPKFTPKESEEYLKLAGFDDPMLRQNIHELTGGNPFYLSLCKKQLESIKGRGENPEISMFGRNTEELFDRFVQNMDAETMNVCYLLSAIYRWNEELIFKITSRFNDTVYENVKKLSFIEELENGTYVINRIFSEVMMEHCPAKIRHDAGNLLVETYLEEIKKKDFASPDFAERISAVLRGSVLLAKDREEVRSFFCKNVKNILYRFIKEEFYNIDFSVFDPFLSYAGRKSDDLLYAEALKCHGVFLYYNGLFREAKSLLEEAKALFEKLLGKDDEETMQTANVLYSVLESLGNTEKTEEIRESIIEKVKACEDTEDIFAISIMSSYAGQLADEGRIQEALIYGKKAYTLSEKLLGENHPETLIHLHNYAYTLHNSGDYRGALQIKEVVLHKMYHVNPTHPNTLCAMLSLAITLDSLGETDKAITLYEEMIKKGEEILGEDHAVVLAAKCSYVNALGKYKRFDEALEIIEFVIEKDKEIYGENHHETLTALHNKSGLYYDMGEFRQAYDIQQEILEKRRALGESEKAEYLRSLSIIAVLKSVLYKDETADSDQMEVVRQYTEIYGENNPHTLEAMKLRGKILENLEKYDKAYKVLNRALIAHEKYYGISSPLTKTVANGAALMMLKGKEMNQQQKQKELKRIMRKYNIQD